MAALNEQFHHKDTTTRSSSRRGTESTESEKSVDVSSLQRSMIADQQFGISDDLLPDTPIPRHRDLGSCLDVDHYSLAFKDDASLLQGMTLDPVKGLYYARNRNYDPSLGRWINQDPAGYINGANTYQFVMGNPVVNVDPMGLWSWSELWPGNWNWSWLPWVPKVAVDTAKQVPPGGEFCEALGTLYGISKSDIARDAHQQLNHDLNNPNARYYGNPLNDPLYNGLCLWAGGDTGNMTPQEHQAVQNWINSHYASHQ
jgi:RHS repeat-associated protein